MDDATLGRLARALEAHPRVVFARLFGSHGRDEAGPRSDVDVGVWLRDPRPDDDLEVHGLATGALRRNDVDVVVLNTAPLSLAFEALKGRLVVDKDEDARILAESAVMARYHDRRHYLARHFAEAASAIRERGFA